MKILQKIIEKASDDKATQRRRKRMIVVVSVITLLSMMTSTFAWFTINTFAGVDKLDLKISVSAQLKVAMEDFGADLDKYVKTITNEMIDTYLAKENTRLADIILDPVTTTNGTRFTNRRGDERAANNRSYLEFEAYFIATEDMWVHLTTESSNIEGDNGTMVTTTSTGARADIVNCPRVSFTTESDGTAIYEPNKGSPVNGQNTFDIARPMVYSNSTRLFHLDGMTPKKVTFRLWIDGEDPECDDDVQAADLSVAMSFIGCDNNNIPIA